MIANLSDFPGVPGRLERIDEGQDFDVFVTRSSGVGFTPLPPRITKNTITGGAPTDDMFEFTGTVKLQAGWFVSLRVFGGANGVTIVMGSNEATTFRLLGPIRG